MKEYDFVEVTVEKEKYAREGVHKGMQGTILDPRNINGQWLVYFADPVTGADTIGIPIKEEDLKLIWEAPERKVGVTVLFLSENEKYSRQGITNGMFGVICEQCQDENYWNVKFILNDGTEKIVPVYYNDMSPIRDDEVEAYRQEVEKALKRRQKS